MACMHAGPTLAAVRPEQIVFKRLQADLLLPTGGLHRLSVQLCAGFQLRLIEDLTQLITVEDAPAVFSLLEDKRALFETDKMKDVLSSNNPVKLALLRACNQASLYVVSLGSAS